MRTTAIEYEHNLTIFILEYADIFSLRASTYYYYIKIDKVDKVPKETMDMNTQVDKNSMVLSRELSSRTKKMLFLHADRFFQKGIKNHGALIHNKHKSNLKFKKTVGVPTMCEIYKDDEKTVCALKILKD